MSTQPQMEDSAMDNQNHTSAAPEPDAQIVELFQQWSAALRRVNALQDVAPEDKIDWREFDIAAIETDEILMAIANLPARGVKGLATKIFLHHVVHPYGQDPSKGDPVALRPTLNSEWPDRMML
jgi:hypothetical protein